MAMSTVMVLVSPVRTTGALPLMDLVKLRWSILVSLRGLLMLHNAPNDDNIVNTNLRARGRKPKTTPAH